jgi:choline dehydrogenase-like flavoprotein
LLSSLPLDEQGIKVKKLIVVGSGAGGATVAKELQGKFQVTVLEAGHSFHPFKTDLKFIEKVKKTGMLFNEKQIQWFFPPMKIDKTGEKMVLVRGIGHGGTTTLSAGNAVRQDRDLRAIGINLDAEFEELSHEIPVYKEHQKKWHPLTREAYTICRDMNLQPLPTPKMIRSDRCVGCGKCVLGCSHKAKWDSREFLYQAVEKGTELVSGSRVQKVVIEKGKAIGVVSAEGWRTRFHPADLIVVAAGGLGTPVILQQSGIECRSNLFVDPVLCVAARRDKAWQNREMPMPFIVQRENYIISPYFDFLSFFFNRNWKYPAGDIFSLMIKLADSNTGTISAKHLKKSLTEKDRQSLHEGVSLCMEILRRMGVKEADIFQGTVNAGHPGGMLPLTEKESSTLHHGCLPANFYVADASLFPDSLGNPPILTIAAMAKRISKLCSQNAS